MEEVYSNSQDLSEASSVVSFDSQETDFTDQTDHTLPISNVTKKIEFSPSDVRNHPDDGSNMVPHVEDPLPVVREGKVLTEESFMEADSHEFVDHADDYANYEHEQQDFTREMNTTKIAFAAYRNAVLHLVHHQDHSTNKKMADINREEKGQDSYSESGSSSSPPKEDNANLRMKILEETAREIVETKARACFEAVEVASEFMEMRKARDGGRNALFQELLKSKTNNNAAPSAEAEQPSRNMDGVDEVEGIGEEEDEFEEEEVDEVAEVVKDAHKSEQMSVEEPKPKSKPMPTKSTTPKPKNASKTKKKIQDDSSKGQSQAFVRRRKATKHPDCILDSFPKFQFQPKSKTEKATNNNDETPATYKTTKWIGNMVLWRSQRNIYKINSYEKCGCPDCKKALKSTIVSQ